MRRHTEHKLTSSAPAQVLYGLVADVSRWPAIFAPSVCVDVLERTERTDRFQLWVTANGAVKTWISRREHDPDGLRIRFEQEKSTAPIASMGGDWIFRPLPDGGTEIVLLHDFTAVDDAAEAVDWINSALDRNSATELAVLARIAEFGHPVEDVVFSFTDTVTLEGSAADAYEFVYRSDLWPERLPHVSRVVLDEEVPNVQDMEMDTVTADGSAHTTRSIRVCFPNERIVYKQLVPPKLLLGHSGRWVFTDTAEGAAVTAEHTVAINPAAVTEVLGEQATLADAREFARSALGKNSRATLTHAGQFARNDH